MVMFSLVLMKTLRSYFGNSSMAGLIPLLTVGIYYGVSGQWHLTQLEAVVGFPMFLCLWFAIRPRHAGGRESLRLFLSGCMGAIVLLFKFVLLPIVAAFWLVAFIDAVVGERRPLLSTLIRISGPVILGVTVPLLVTLAYFAANNTMGLLYWTWFEYPAQLMNEPPYTNSVVNGLRWLISQFASLLALAFFGSYVSLTSGRDRLLTVNLIVWPVLGVGVILVQRFSRWEYHYLLLVVPLGILSVKALDILWEQLKTLGPPVNSWSGRLAGGLGLVLLFSPVLVLLAKKGLDLTRHGFALTKEHRRQYQLNSSVAYAGVRGEVSFLSEPGCLPGDIYVFGDPTYYLLSGRGQAIALNGWGPELWLPSQSSRLNEQLAEACPSYIFNGMGNLVAERSPETARFIDENYQAVRKSNRGVWYARKEKQERKCGTNHIVRPPMQQPITPKEQT
jgi:hypothetical protein